MPQQEFIWGIPGPRPSGREVMVRFGGKLLKRTYVVFGTAAVSLVLFALGFLGLPWWFVGPLLVLALLNIALFLVWRDEFLEGVEHKLAAEELRTTLKRKDWITNRYVDLGNCYREGRELLSRVRSAVDSAYQGQVYPARDWAGRTQTGLNLLAPDVHDDVAAQVQALQRDDLSQAELAELVLLVSNALGAALWELRRDEGFVGKGVGLNEPKQRVAE